MVIVGNGQLLVIWIGKRVSSEFLVHVFGVDRIEAVDVRKVIVFAIRYNPFLIINAYT